jgi:hypothetical protein
LLKDDAAAMHSASVPISKGDLRCLLAGHMARVAVNGLRRTWDCGLPLVEKMDRATLAIRELRAKCPPDTLVKAVLQRIAGQHEAESQSLAATV